MDLRLGLDLDVGIGIKFMVRIRVGAMVWARLKIGVRLALELWFVLGLC